MNRAGRWRALAEVAPLAFALSLPLAAILRPALNLSIDPPGESVARWPMMGISPELERSVGELEAERDRVSGLLQARRQLVAGVSHELRTPVATVRGYLESVQRRESELPPEVRADLEIITRENERLERLIEDLFTLSRAEVDRLALRLAPTDVGAVVRRLAETAGRWRGAGAACECWQRWRRGRHRHARMRRGWSRS